MARVRLLAFLSAALFAAAPLGAADAQSPPFQLEGPLPFSAAELEAAAELRVPSWPGLSSQAVIVRSHAPGEVELELRGWRRTLPLGSAQGSEAARLVALALADLALAIASAPAAPPPNPEAERAKAASNRPGTAASPAPDFTRVALGAGAGRGLGALEPWTFGLALAVTRTFEPFLLDADLGFALSPARGRAGVRTSSTAVPLRIDAGVRVASFLELLAGPAFVALWVSGGDGFFGVLPAFGLRARAVARLGPTLDAVLSTGADLFVRRVELRVYGTTALATPRLAPWVGLALGWRTPG